MELYAIPIEDKFILYRPLLRLAFIGNRAMADLVQRLANDGSSGDDLPEEIDPFCRVSAFSGPIQPRLRLPATPSARRRQSC